MEKETRGAIEKATQKARSLLEEDFAEQLQGDYDVMEDGRVGEKPGSHLSGRQKALRARIVAAIDHKRMAGMTAKEAVADFLRDAAFTVLNRFVALKMLEARGLVLECISKGEASSGFATEFSAFAPGIKLPDGSGYRLYIESIFDELSFEVKVLFERRDPASTLWPRKSAFEALLELLNARDLVACWGEDETIGWVYQYFNSDEERREMRDDSQAPRNSHEMAVRNQFFTPNYVVQFLSDNTLGRVWYDMRKGDTSLADLCAFMLRNPGEVFQQEGDCYGMASSCENATQDELWRRQLLVPLHKKKDPRSIRAIDPACGSGHFLLYLFGMFLVIYVEAWRDLDGPVFEGTGKSLRNDYPSLEALHLAVPALILTHNLFGVDIDPRCVQIAQLALWMRAQRAYQEFGVSRADRPSIRKSNMVVAEPMPLDNDLVETFSSTLTPPVIGSLFKELVSEMRLAGEIGSLLPIDQKIASSIQRAKKTFDDSKMVTWQGFLPGMSPEGDHSNTELRGIDHSSFFEEAEARMFSALRGFVAGSANGTGTRRRLFAEDSEQGLAFIELMQKHYDVVLMNPPFGAASEASAGEIDRCYPISRVNVYSAFVERGIDLLLSGGRLGVISPRSGFFLSSFEKWRQRVVLEKGILCGAVDLGYGVLEAKVETAAYTILKPRQKHMEKDPAIHFINLQHESEKATSLSSIVSDLNEGNVPSQVSIVRESELKAIPTSPFAYDLTPAARGAFKTFPTFANNERTVKAGIQTSDDFRFVRLWWEVSANDVIDIPQNFFDMDCADFQSEVIALTRKYRWCGYAKGGEYSPFYGDIPLVINWKNNGAEAKAFAETTPGTKHWSRRMPASEYYFLPGLTFLSRTSVRMCAFPLPAGVLFSNEAGPAIFGPKDELPIMLARFNSLAMESLLSVFQSRGLAGDDQTKKYMVGTLQVVPWPNYATSEVSGSNLRLVELMRSLRATDETSPHYTTPVLSPGNILRAVADEAIESEKRVADAYGLDSVSALGARRDKFTQSLLIAQKKTSEEQAAYSFLMGFAHSRSSSGPPHVLDPFRYHKPQAMLSKSANPILCDDPGAELDVVAVLSEPRAIRMLPVDAAKSYLNPDCMREYFRNRFFERHIKHYSRSQRKAPIYWQISVPSGEYSVWIYVHAFSRDTLFLVQNDFVIKRLDRERRQLEVIRTESGVNPTAAQSKAIERQIAFVDEIQSLRDDVARLLPLWNPSLNDGVIINAAPFWRLFGRAKSWQSDCRTVWNGLCAGEYDWSHLAMNLWPERVVPKCASDRSLAIAHELDDIFWFDEGGGKWKPRKEPSVPIDQIVAQRTSLAVKIALKAVIDAPVLPSPAKRGRKSKGV